MCSSQEVNQIVGELRDGVSAMFAQEQMETIVFGSYARGDAEKGSDIDVLFLVDASREKIMERNWKLGELAAELLMKYGVLVSPIVENRGYFYSNAEVLPFFRNVDREGVRVSA
ncbi:nucleotidyltransferase domain-containing protein [Oscillospiraceae bacterium 42-9]